MAARYVTGTTSSASASTTVATVNGTRTILQLIADSDVQVTLIEWGISFDNTNSALAPIKVLLQRQTTAGTGLTSGNVQKLGPPGIPSANTTSLTGVGASAEPTAGDILGLWNINPTSGWVQQYPLGREPMMDVSTRLALVTVGVTANISNATAYMVFEE